MINVKNVSKKYKNKLVLDDINLSINGLYGLIGPNGAGKTTLMRILAGLIAVDDGEVSITDETLQLLSIKEIRENIGYLPQDFNIYPRASVNECLEHIAVLKGLPKKYRSSKIDEVLQQVNLLDHKHKKIYSLSGGMRKRVGIAQMLLTEPKFLIIDEPTAGLDIYERIRFRNLLQNIAKDRTIIISSHIVEDVEFLCTKIGILKNGRILQEGTPLEISSFSEGLVWNIKVKIEQLNFILQDYMVTNLEHTDNNFVNVRVLSNKKPLDAVLLKPKLLDGYLSIIKGE